MGIDYHSVVNWIPSYDFFLVFVCLFFMAAPVTHGNSWARDWIPATYAQAVAMPDLLTHCSRLRIKPEPLETWATAVRFLTHCVTVGIPWLWFLKNYIKVKILFSFILKSTLQWFLHWHDNLVFHPNKWLLPYFLQMSEIMSLWRIPYRLKTCYDLKSPKHVSRTNLYLLW